MAYEYGVGDGGETGVPCGLADPDGGDHALAAPAESGQEQLERVASLVTSMLDVPLVIVSLEPDFNPEGAATGQRRELYHALVAGTPGLLVHPDAIALCLDNLPATPGARQVRSRLSVTLVTATGARIGALHVYDTRERRFTTSERTALRDFAHLMVSGIELWRHASHDGLTGAMSRGCFIEGLERETARYHRKGTPCGLVMLDLDHFKEINDRHGHAAGDMVLRAVADTVRDEMRAEDAFGRLGGEEFALLISGGALQVAQEVGERVRAAVERTTIPGHPGLKVTASLGVAEITPEENTAEALLASADARLYEAKTAGRNRVGGGELGPRLVA